MREEILIPANEKLAFEADSVHQVVYVYHAEKSKPDQRSKAVLKSIDPVLAKQIEEYFGIDIEKHGVVIDKAAPRNVNEEEKKKIFKHRFLKTVLFY